MRSWISKQSVIMISRPDLFLALLKATIRPEAIAETGMYIVTLKCEGEARCLSRIEPISWWAMKQ